MQLAVNDNGAVKAISQVHVNDNGTVRQILQGWVNDNGTVKQFFGGDVISIGNVFVVDSGVHPVTGTYRLSSDGFIYRTILGSIDQAGAWLTPQVNMANYEARATVTSGTLSSGTAGSWLNLGTTRTWTRSTTGAGQVQEVVFDLEIRRASDSVVLDTATITINVESS